MKKFILILAALMDFVILTCSLPVLRIIMIHSPLFDASAPQWESQRYWISGFFLAATYFLTALVSGFYSRNKNIKKTKVPTVNFAIITFIFSLGLLACWRYGVVTSDMQFISKRALLFSMVISYFFTTLIHYLIALYFNKEEL
ncbi:hypothetical protein KAH27_01420 [bacterium]|nr:hypothetical protein [bacterium]